MDKNDLRIRELERESRFFMYESWAQRAQVKVLASKLAAIHWRPDAAADVDADSDYWLDFDYWLDWAEQQVKENEARRIKCAV